MSTLVLERRSRVLDALPFSVASAATADGGATVFVAGELDLATAGELERLVGERVEDASSLTLDLGGLTFVDCSGLRAVMNVCAAARGRGVPVRVTALSAPLRRLLELLPADDRLTEACRARPSARASDPRAQPPG